MIGFIPSDTKCIYFRPYSSWRFWFASFLHFCI